MTSSEYLFCCIPSGKYLSKLIILFQFVREYFSKDSFVIFCVNYLPLKLCESKRCCLQCNLSESWPSGLRQRTSVSRQRRTSSVGDIWTF